MPHVVCGIAFEIVGLDVPSQIFQDAVLDSLGQSIPHDHVLQRLPAIVWGARRVDDADQAGVFRQVVNRLADLF